MKQRIAALRRKLPLLIPPNTFLGRWTRRFYRLIFAPRHTFRHMRYRHTRIAAPGLLERDTVDIYLLRAGYPRLNKLAHRSPDNRLTLVSRILFAWFEREDLRKQFPQGFREGSQGGLCRALCENLPQEQAVAFRQIFDAGLEKQIGNRYHSNLTVRVAHPLGLTSAGREDFLDWCFTHSRSIRVTAEEVLWYLAWSSQDSTDSLAETYLISPDWQETFPDGLTPEGWPRLGVWLAETEGYPAEHFDRLPPPVPLSPEATPGEGINVLSYFRYPSGLREAALHTVEALAQQKIPTSKRDVSAGMLIDLPGRSEYLGLEPYDISLIHTVPEPLDTIYRERAALRIRPDIHRIGVWYWELETIPGTWKNFTKGLDEIWTPSHFIHQAIQKSLSVSVTPMPPGIAPPQMPILPRSRFGLDDSKFLFLFLFDMHSVMERKNPLGLIEAYRRAFGNSTEVQMAIKVSRGTSVPGDFRKLCDAANNAGVVVINEVLSREEVCGLMYSADCYASLHRSEGFGLTLAEAMFMKKPVIATGYSGNLDFMTHLTSRLIPHTMIAVPGNQNIYPSSARWAAPDLNEATQAMRWVVEHPAAAKQMAEAGHEQVARVLSLEAYGQRMQRRLDEIRQKTRRVLRAA